MQFRLYELQIANKLLLIKHEIHSRLSLFLHETNISSEREKTRKKVYVCNHFQCLLLNSTPNPPIASEAIELPCI